MHGTFTLEYEILSSGSQCYRPTRGHCKCLHGSFMQYLLSVMPCSLRAFFPRIKYLESYLDESYMHNIYVQCIATINWFQKAIYFSFIKVALPNSWVGQWSLHTPVNRKAGHHLDYQGNTFCKFLTLTSATLTLCYRCINYLVVGGEGEGHRSDRPCPYIKDAWCCRC